MLEDFEYSEKKSNELKVHQENYLKGPMVKEWLRKYLEEIRKISDDDLIERYSGSLGFHYQMYTDIVSFSLSDIDISYIEQLETMRRSYLSREFHWRRLFAYEKFIRKARDFVPAVWDYWVTHPNECIPVDMYEKMYRKIEQVNTRKRQLSRKEKGVKKEPRISGAD